MALIVGALAVLQFCFYFRWEFRGGLNWIYFDPRIGLGMVIDVLGFHGEGPMALQWASAVWQASVAIGMFLKPAWLRFYLIGEIVLSLPSILFFVLILLANMSASHGFSPRELVLPGAVFVCFSVIPFLAATWVYRSGVARVA
jgi:cytochrome c oxidase subunit IV